MTISTDLRPADMGTRHFFPHQRSLEALRADYRGQPVNEVKTAVQREWLTMEGSALPDSEVTALAEAVSEGRPIQLFQV